MSDQVVAITSQAIASLHKLGAWCSKISLLGLKPPLLIIGDGALGLWNAVDELPELAATRSQRCWVHKIANVLDKLPK